MNEFALLFVFIIWVGTSYVVSSFFNDRDVSRMTIFWLSLFLSPVIGILIGISSRRITSPRVLSYSYNKRKDILLSKIERLKKEEVLGIISDQGLHELDLLVQEYKTIDQKKEEEILELRHKKEIEKKLRRESDKETARNFIKIAFLLITIVFTILLIVFSTIST